MNIHFSPISMIAGYTMEVSGDSIIIDGVQHPLADLAALGDEDERPPFVVSATADSVTLLLPYWGSASEAVLYPAPLVGVVDGPVEMPE